MGSFSSKMRTTSTSSGCSGKGSISPNSRPSRMAESSNTQPRASAADVSNDDEPTAGSASQEQTSENKVGPSFLWLVETPVVLPTTAKGLTRPDKREKTAAEANGKSANKVVTFDNGGKYVKSVELPSTSNVKPSVQSNASPSTSSFEKHGKYPKHDGWRNYQETAKDLEYRRATPSLSNSKDASTRPRGARAVGFGVAKKKDSAAEPRSADCSVSAYSRDCKGEGEGPHSPQLQKRNPPEF